MADTDKLSLNQHTHQYKNLNKNDEFKNFYKISSQKHFTCQAERVVKFSKQIWCLNQRRSILDHHQSHASLTEEGRR